MSLQTRPIPPIPEMTAQVARAAFRKGNVYMQMRDLLGTFFTDDQFVDLYPADRQAADAVRSRIDWKYALSLDLTDEGFDFSVLSEFRQRLLVHDAGENLLNTLLDQFREAGLLSNGGKQRTDSTHVVASVRDLNRLELVGRTLQQALDAIATVSPQWLQDQVPLAWFSRYSRPLSEFILPQKRAERDALALQIGHDGIALMNAIYFGVDAPSYLRNLDAVEILRQVWIQQYVVVNDTLRWRERKEMPPAARLIQSPFDIEARFSRKRSREWIGYKVHVTETCNDNAPHLITNIDVVNATEQDVDAVTPIHDTLKARDLLPDVHLVDRGYTSALLLYDSKNDYNVELFGPVVEKQVWQHATGYDMSAFTIDWKNRTVTCPQGHTSNPWTMRDHRRDHQLTRVKFKRVECEPCPVHDLCTKHTRRTLSFHEEGVFKVVQKRKQDQHTDVWRKQYGTRAGVEGTISQGVFALRSRRSRYRGQDKTQLQFILTATAMNVTRVLNWIDDIPRSQTRITRFGRLIA